MVRETAVEVRPFCFLAREYFGSLKAEGCVLASYSYVHVDHGRHGWRCGADQAAGLHDAAKMWPIVHEIYARCEGTLRASSS
jgi:hypothetical protein